jgi:hypothetical protein
MSGMMWQNSGFLFDVCVKIFYINCAYPLNPNNIECKEMYIFGKFKLPISKKYDLK